MTTMTRRTALALAFATLSAGVAHAQDKVVMRINFTPWAMHAQYYGGLMHYRAGRPDRMAARFEQFLRLAPEAPERPEVMQIMKTVRGR